MSYPPKHDYGPYVHKQLTANTSAKITNSSSSRILSDHTLASDSEVTATASVETANTFIANDELPPLDRGNALLGILHNSDSHSVFPLKSDDSPLLLNPIADADQTLPSLPLFENYSSSSSLESKEKASMPYAVSHAHFPVESSIAAIKKTGEMLTSSLHSSLAKDPEALSTSSKNRDKTKKRNRDEKKNLSGSGKKAHFSRGTAFKNQVVRKEKGKKAAKRASTAASEFSADKIRT